MSDVINIVCTSGSVMIKQSTLPPDTSPPYFRATLCWRGTWELQLCEAYDPYDPLQWRISGPITPCMLLHSSAYFTYTPCQAPFCFVWNSASTTDKQGGNCRFQMEPPSQHRYLQQCKWQMRANCSITKKRMRRTCYPPPASRKRLIVDMPTIVQCFIFGNTGVEIFDQGMDLEYSSRSARLGAGNGDLTNSRHPLYEVPGHIHLGDQNL
ncbi:hypothetical protein DFH27DRAFT_63298 [Peziza echinospora]|nr:hypothetical protein DFH27DRAFT_63298 [Peziza echinospora]